MREIGLAACDCGADRAGAGRMRRQGVSPLAVGAAGPGLSRGIDMATDCRDVSQELKGSDLHFVARYYRDPASRLPPLTAEEARAVAAAGKKLVTVWQYQVEQAGAFLLRRRSGRRHVGASAGQGGRPAAWHRDLFRGRLQRAGAGYSRPDRPVFPRRRAQVWRRPAGKSREYRIGVYGSGAVCGYLKRARLAEYRLAVGTRRAWAGYAQLCRLEHQAGLRSTALSFDHDINEARGEFGAFTVQGARPAVAVAGVVKSRSRNDGESADAVRPQQCLCPHPARRVALHARCTRTSTCWPFATSTRRRRPTSS